jgi:hypothetical protein
MDSRDGLHMAFGISFAFFGDVMPRADVFYPLIFQRDDDMLMLFFLFE